MLHSTSRIRVSHAGALPRPDKLEDSWMKLPGTSAAFEAGLPDGVRETVAHQVEIGIDTVNDGEISKQGGFSGYIRDRVSGIEQHPWSTGRGPNRGSINSRDRKDFPGFFKGGHGGPLRPQAVANNDPYFAAAPLSYVGIEAVQADITRLLAATTAFDVESYLPAVAPGTMEHWLWNEYYPDQESLLFAIADVLHEEYKAITDAGIVLQIDNPDLPDGWQMFPDMSVKDYRSYAELRVDALNHALRDIPTELVRLHVCWGSGHGPHTNDIPLADIVDIVLKVDAECYSIEAANPAHEHEWTVWEEAKLPDGKILMPGVVGHSSGVIEHPELVAQRIELFARLVGKENVIAGTDCGMAPRVVHPEICWAKLAALSEGARIASGRLWN
jgi:5-methyltetrahydropteroyltriglutamate--homocysteine methyltransferase